MSADSGRREVLMSTGKLLTLSETEEELRQLSWQLRITRDQVLKMAETLPPEFRERVEKVAEQLTGLSAHLRRLITLLPNEPAGLPSPIRVDVGLDGLRLSVDELAANVSSLMAEMNLVSGNQRSGKGSLIH
jgi:hypothetical protein